jgi:UDP-N-acetylmuramate dehydrogenase
MEIQKNINLANYTTFKIGGDAKFFCSVKSEDELIKAVEYAQINNLKTFVLGGGSNILVSDGGFNGLVIKLDLKGISYSDTYVTASAGEDWDAFVGETISRGLYGLENLSAIPGTVGAAPVQNIGAYGVEASSVISKVRALDTNNKIFVDLRNEDCGFTYRSSIFKQERGRYIIVSVDFILSKDPKVNTVYKDVQEYFNVNNISNPSPVDVRKAVIEIRRRKLPDLKLWGTAGSFFKNPIISQSEFDSLQIKYPEVVSFKESDGRIKVSLAWIIDKVCGLKDYCLGNACTYQNQALVIVTKAGGTSSDVDNLAQHIVNMVKEKTGLYIEREVESVG